MRARACGASKFYSEFPMSMRKSESSSIKLCICILCVLVVESILAASDEFDNKLMAAKHFRIESQENASSDTQNPTTTTTVATGRSKTSVHVTALDGIVNVNSLFTMATFIGLSLTQPAASSAGNPESCNPSINTVRRIIVFEVVSFSFFLFSSLIAQSLKLAINLLNSLDLSDPHKADIDSSFHKYALFGSAIGSVMGSVFLMLSIVDFVQVKLGVLSCGDESVYAVVTLVVFAGSGLLVYITTSIYAAFFM